MKLPEVESRLLTLINEIKAQREIFLYEFDGVEDFEKKIEFIQSFAEHCECGLAFESLIWWFEEIPVKLSSTSASLLVELSLHFGYRTKDVLDARFNLSNNWLGTYKGDEYEAYDPRAPIAPPATQVKARLPEVESRLVKLIDEVEAQRATILYEFDGTEDFEKQIASLRSSVERFDYGAVYERLICCYEQMPLQLCGPNAVYLVELALHFGYKTTRPEDARFDLSKHWLGGCTSNVFQPEQPAA